jgi:hypothetical protein
MSKFGNIVQGWGNYVFPRRSVERLAKARAEICSKCPHAVKGKHEVIRDGRIESLSAMMCKICVCPLSAKLRSPQERCPIGNW